MPSKKPPDPQQGLFGLEAPPRGDEDAPPVSHAEGRARRPPDEPRIWQVAELVRAASRALEARFSQVWVEGEISNLSQPRSGHVYFTLVDGQGQLPAVLWRSQAERLKFRLSDGLQVRVRGRLAIYEAGGKFQLYAEALEPAGLGARELAFLQLKEKLEREGLFDEARKRPLPRWPRCVGLATSATGAALRDMLRVAERRGRVRFLLAPCQVQGEAAPGEISQAVRLLEAQPDVELIIVGRGGGSAEDLAAFNDEALARILASCRVPVVSAVGHEVDFTIADFVADLRAPTPSAAAELVVPVWAEWRTRLDDAQRRIARAGQRALADGRQRLELADQRAEAALDGALAQRRRQLDALRQRLTALHPSARLGRDRAQLDALSQRLTSRVEGLLEGQRATLGQLVGRLGALSPLSVLERGYSLTRTVDGRVVTRAAQVAVGDELEVQLAEGSLRCEVRGTEPG